MSAESRKAFFRQGGWMVLATTAGGVFMSAVHTVTSKINVEEYAVFVALLRCLIVLGIPTAGFQTVFAQQAAGAITDLQNQELRRTVRAVMSALFIGWIALAMAVFVGENFILNFLQIKNAAALWMTVFVVLTSLWQPILRGILQGQQNFMAMGWIAILDGVGRFAAVCVIILVLKKQAAGAMGAALLGQIGSLMVCLWWTRDILRGNSAPFRWRHWFARLAPLTCGFGALLFMQNADVIYVQSLFSTLDAPFYMAPAVIGFALVQFTGPLVAVMFPKIVRSVARSETTDALKLTFITTLAVGALAAVVCAIFPELPIRILYFAKPDYLKSAPLVPWFVWCMLFTTLANVLIGNLLARQKFSIVPWLILTATGYGAALFFLRDYLRSMEPFDSFRRLVQVLGVFNFLLLVLAVWFTWRKPSETLRQQG